MRQSFAKKTFSWSIVAHMYGISKNITKVQLKICLIAIYTYNIEKKTDSLYISWKYGRSHHI